ncbi:MAG: hypothetical protein ACD_75C00209G0002 [uncultured bacterium]|nr:MAG: hypothetical protein ACD_75C00209G0002 [uncultured bacterium]
MKGHKAGFGKKVVQQDGDVGKTDDWLWIVADQFQVYFIDHPDTAIASPESNEGLHLRVPVQFIDFPASIVIGVGKVIVAGPELPRELHMKAHFLQDSDPAGKTLPVGQMAGRCDYANRIAFLQDRWIKRNDHRCVNFR